MQPDRFVWAWALLAAVSCARARTSEAPAAAPAEPPAESVPQEPAVAAPGGEPYASTSTEFRTLAEAESALAEAKAEIDRLGGAPPTAGAAAPPSAKAEESAARAADVKKADGGCDDACRAFASLARAADAVCRLDTQNTGRCERARQTVVDAERRLASCGCRR
jgi:hypothetical protein